MSVLRNLFLVVLVGLLGSIAWAQVNLSGQQIRGQGSNGKLVCGGINLPQGGVIVGVQCSGDGFWLEGPGGVKQFRTGNQAVNTQLAPGNYKAFPNLKPQQNEAGVSVQIRSGRVGAAAPNAGTRGEDRRSSGATQR